MHDHILKDYGDLLYNAIEKSRTPLTDELLRIVIFLVVSMIVLSVVEFPLRRMMRKPGHDESSETTLNLIFSMIRYVILLTAVYIAIRACISELTYTKANNIRDVILWLHNDTRTLFDYSIKILVALIIFIIFNAGQNFFFKKLQKHLEKRDVNEGFSHFLVTLIRIVLLSFIAISSALQLMITGGDSLIALAIFFYICFIIAVPLKSFRQTLEKKDKDMTILISLITWTMGVIILVSAAFGIFNGLNYLLTSGGKEISPYLQLTEEKMADELHTYFLPDPDLSVALSGKSSERLSVESDGELNLLYLNGRKIGVNTSGRKYQFFGVSINQPEITAVDQMNYDYEMVGTDVSLLESGASHTTCYCRPSKNDCLVLTVNSHSNRIVNMTYYSDYSILAPHITPTPIE